MKTYPAPTQNEYKDFLIRVYFGTGPEYLRPCIRRAYLDFCRTLHGISRIPGIYQHAGSAIEKSITNLKNDSINTGQESFDDWHHAACNHLRTIYSDHGYEAFSIGQAQKWLNMSFKYAFTIGDKRLPGYSRFFQFCHVPLDNIIINRLKSYNPPPLSRSWSRLQDYEEYLHFQQWLRDTFENSIPLAVEFHMWLKQLE